MDFDADELLQVPGIPQLFVVQIAALLVLAQECLVRSDVARGSPWIVQLPWELCLVRVLLLELRPDLGIAHEDV